MAISEAQKEVQSSGALPVPLHIRNAPTQLMKTLDYGKNYQYAHNFEDHVVTQTHLPDALKNSVYYHPKESGYEKTIKERLEWLARKKQERRDKKQDSS